MKRERANLTERESMKIMEFQKKEMHYKKLRVLDKHSRIEEQTNKLQEGKNKLVECSRIANELRVQHLVDMHSP